MTEPSETKENSDEKVDLNKENKKLKFALWMTRANYCRSFNVSEYFMNHTTTRNFREFSLKLEAAAVMCREKADEYDDRPPEEKLKKPDIMWTFKERK
jgi:hypothetical protein